MQSGLRHWTYQSWPGLCLFMQLARVRPASEACSASIASRAAAVHLCRRRETEIPLSLTLLAVLINSKKKKMFHISREVLFFFFLSKIQIVLLKRHTLSEPN